MQITLMICDDASFVATRILFDSHRVTFDHVLEANASGNFTENWNTVGIPLTEYGILCDFLVFFNHEYRTGRNLKLLQLASFRVENGDFTISGEDDRLSFFTGHRSQTSELDHTTLLRFGFTFFHVSTGNTTDVECPHRQLCTWFTDTLCSNDTDGHAFFHLGTAGHVHAIAGTANSESRFAGHWATNLDAFQTELFDASSNLIGDHLIFRNDHFIRHWVDNVRPADTTVDGIRQSDFHLLTTVDDSLCNALGGAAIFHRNHDVLSDIGQLTGKITGVGRFKCRIGQTFTGTVRRTEVFEHRETFSEIGFNRRLDNFTGRLSHQASHPG